MNKPSLTLGERIYYTGDRANDECAGTIVAINPPKMHTLASGQTVEILGITVEIEYDDGRTTSLSPCHFDPGPGRRFWLLDEWNAHRRARMALLVQSLRKGNTPP